MHFSVFLLQKIKYFKLHHILFSRLVAEGQKRAEQEGKLERKTFMFAKYKYNTYYPSKRYVSDRNEKDKDINLATFL